MYKQTLTRNNMMMKRIECESFKTPDIYKREYKEDHNSNNRIQIH